MLDTLKKTATGLDELPSWFLRISAPFLAEPLANLFSLSLTSASIPLQWKEAYIVPISKLPAPTAPADYRPISITSVLSCTIEKIVVRDYIYPALFCMPPSLSVEYQFAFRPTGSTSAAIIYILDKVTHLLQTNQYVRIIALDFSKALDTVRHQTLMDKIARLNS